MTENRSLEAVSPWSLDTTNRTKEVVPSFSCEGENECYEQMFHQFEGLLDDLNQSLFDVTYERKLESEDFACLGLPHPYLCHLTSSSRLRSSSVSICFQPPLGSSPTVDKNKNQIFNNKKESTSFTTSKDIAVPPPFTTSATRLMASLCTPKKAKLTFTPSKYSKPSNPNEGTPTSSSSTLIVSSPCSSLSSSSTTNAPRSSPALKKKNPVIFCSRFLTRSKGQRSAPTSFDGLVVHCPEPRFHVRFLPIPSQTGPFFAWYLHSSPSMTPRLTLNPTSTPRSSPYTKYFHLFKLSLKSKLSKIQWGQFRTETKNKVTPNDITTAPFPSLANDHAILTNESATTTSAITTTTSSVISPTPIATTMDPVLSSTSSTTKSVCACGSMKMGVFKKFKSMFKSKF